MLCAARDAENMLRACTKSGNSSIGGECYNYVYIDASLTCVQGKKLRRSRTVSPQTYGWDLSRQICIHKALYVCQLYTNVFAHSPVNNYACACAADRISDHV